MVRARVTSTSVRAPRVRLGAVAIALVVGCGGPPPPRNVKETAIVEPARPTPPSTVTTLEEEPKPFHATSGPGDSPVAFVRDERSSRLDRPMPRGRAREEWTVPLGGSRREPCRGACAPAQAPFVLAAGNRVAVTGADGWVLFDVTGKRIDSGKIEPSGVRIDRASGAMVADETRSADTPADARVAASNGLVVMVKSGGVFVGERAIEGRFEAYDVAIDDNGVACVLVRQADDLLLWTVPLSAGRGIGRQRIPGGPRRVLAPPVLGKKLRVLVLETGILALGLDGKRAWERRGVPTGGVSITSDDHVLVANDSRIVAIDPRGRETEVWSGKDVVFVTPPILNASGLLLVASAEALHAFSFS